MQIIKLKTEDLQVQSGYNVRTAREVTANAKDIAAEMELTGDDPELRQFLVEFVQAGKEKYTRSHATLEAAIERGWKEVCAIKLPFEPNSPEDIAHLYRSNNGGHPLSRRQLGEMFARLRDGILESEEDAIARIKTGEEVKLKYIKKPMSLEDIGAIFYSEKTKRGLSGAWVSMCLAAYDAGIISPEVGELFENDQLSPAISDALLGWAKRLAGDDEDKIPAAILRIAKKAIAAAKADGKGKATDKHMKSIKAELFPLKAAPSLGTTPNPTPEKKKESKSVKEPETPPATTSELGTPAPAGESQPSLPGTDAAPNSEPEDPTAKAGEAFGLIVAVLQEAKIKPDLAVIVAKKIIKTLGESKFLADGIPF